MTLPRTIVVATDFSEDADQALAYGVELAKRLDAAIHLVHAIAFPPVAESDLAFVNVAPALEATKHAAQAALDARTTSYRDRLAIASVRIEIGDPREVIDRVAEEIGADLIIMGTHGRRVKRMLMGSVAESVVRTAPCPVLTVRGNHPPRDRTDRGA